MRERGERERGQALAEPETELLFNYLQNLEGKNLSVILVMVRTTQQVEGNFQTRRSAERR